MSTNSNLDGKLALVFATISRPHVVQRLVLSVRKYFPDVPIYIADQSYPNSWMEQFYSENNCSVAWMDHDAGVCASRNAAVTLVKERYFVLCDDDFIMTENTDFCPAIRLLDADSGIGVVGGRLIDIHENAEAGVIHKDQRFWELQFHYDAAKGSLITIPVHYLAPYSKKTAGVRHFECDAVMNFAVFRTAMFDDVIRWDPQFKTNGEHEDFYLNLKVNGRHRVVYTPELVALHNHPPLQAYSQLRLRNRGWQLFLDKWKLNQFLELDGGIRITNDVDYVRPYAMGYRDFYSSGALTTKKSENRKGMVRISNVTDEIVSRTQALLFDDDGSHGTDFRNFRIGLDGSIILIGGSWERFPLVKLAQSKKSVLDLTENPQIEWLCELPMSDDGWTKGDLFAYLRPSLEPLDERSELSHAEVLFSVAKKGSYAVFRKPTLAYSQVIALNTWNALSVPNPNLYGDLTVEITVLRKGKVLFETSKALFVKARSLTWPCDGGNRVARRPVLVDGAVADFAITGSQR